MGCCQSTGSTDIEEEIASQKRPTINCRSVWDIHELLAETEKIDSPSAKNIVNLFENQNTIPFICRYRRDLINEQITPDKLRDIKCSYTDIVELRKRATAIIGELEKVIVVNDEIRSKLLCAKTVKELEFLHAVYKPRSKVTPLAGLEDHAYRLLIGSAPPVQLITIVDRTLQDWNTSEKVNNAICHIISQQFIKHEGVLDELRRLQKLHKFVLKCTRTKIQNDPHIPSEGQISKKGETNYETYFKFEHDIRYLKPHQILHIDRGEKLKFLSVQVIVANNFKISIRNYIHGAFMCDGLKYALRNEIFEKAFNECYTTKLVPLVCKQVRANLTDAAKRHAVEVFAKNLKQLLLMPPLKGERILGIDPGFRNGCKLALISETADVLEVGVVYPNNGNNPENCGIKLANLLKKHSCKIIALGNGRACRETETWLRALFDKGILDSKYVTYIIVSEQGTSVYSCSKIAKEEFPKLDLKLISAVSIARRLNDPLSEYVKVEPRHLGVGMYQHDLNENFLAKSLNEVVSECVSFVGVDINTASLSLLKHIAGLNAKRAENIIRYRQRNGPFRTRKDLLHVPTVGEKEFIQCAGFIRIEPKGLGGKVHNVLDCTWVHPESYTVASKIIKNCNLELKEIGKPKFISTIKAFANANPAQSLVRNFGIPIERLQVVLDALQRPLFEDYRPEFNKNLFKREIIRYEDLFIGEIVTGEVRNIVDFGAFIDIGLEKQGLIHKSQMQGMKLKIGDKISSTVLNVDIPLKRVGLRLDEVI